MVAAPTVSRSITIGSVTLELADSLSRYAEWRPPTAIIVDGPYGVAGYEGDPLTPGQLPEHYEPHLAAWSTYALPETSLWFWGTEVGWASVHALFDRYGWDYKAAHVWDKGIAHVAGNVNSKTIRGFPITTEVCVQYTRRVTVESADGEPLPLKQWLRAEWRRSGLPLSKTNEAAGVVNAATRKYFTQDGVWYFPPPETMERIAAYANTYGAKTERPYFSLDGVAPLTARSWSRMRAKWNHAHGVTNVWPEPAVRGSERLKDANARILHTNQKPLRLMERIVLASTDPGDVVWETHGGLFTGALAAGRNGRVAYAAEIQPEFYELGLERVQRDLAGQSRSVAGSGSIKPETG